MREIVSEIEGLFLRDCGEDLSASDKELLHVAVRIAADFYAYLQDKAQDRYPSADDAGTSYVIGTLRSGFDEVFAVTRLNSILQDGIDTQLSTDQIATFDLFRQRYMTTFAALRDVDTKVQGRFRHLADLGKLHLIFVGLALT